MKYRLPRVRHVQRRNVMISAVACLAILSASATVGLSRGDSIDLKLAIELAAQAKSEAADSATAAAKKGLWVTGDSVILGIRSKLQSHLHIALINARVGRQIQELTAVVKADRAQVPRSIVILDLGNNNHLTEQSVVDLLDLLKDQPQIVLVNTAVPRSYRDDNNKIINRVSRNYPQLTVVDWKTLSTGHPEFFAADGVHLSDSGSDVYVAAILEVLNKST